MSPAARAIPTLLLAVVVAQSVRGQSPVTGGVSFATEPITTVERTQIAVTVSVPRGVVVEPWAEAYEAALEGAGWTVIRTEVGAPALAGPASVATTRTFVVEPFLDGAYAVPDLVVEARAADGERFLATLEGGGIEVRSVLPPDEASADPLGLDGDGDARNAPPGSSDAPLGSLAPPPDLPEPGRSPLVFVLAAGALVAFGVLARLALRRPKGPRPPEDPRLTLKRLARIDAPTEDDLARAHAALAVLTGPSGEPALLDRFERARYAPDRPSPTERSALIAEAARVARGSVTAANAPRGVPT
jgi:hypothetical protein